MKLLKLIKEKKFVFGLFIAVITLIIFDVILSIWDQFSLKFELSALILMIANLATLFGILTALSIPFLMKSFDENVKQTNEKNIVLFIIKRVKKFLEYFIDYEIDAKSESLFGISQKFSSSMPFFRTIFQKFPEILIKIGIEINTEELQIADLSSKPRIYKYSELYILNTYILKLVPKLSLYNSLEDNQWAVGPDAMYMLSPSPSLYNIIKDKKLIVNQEVMDKILSELIDNVNKNFRFKISIADLK